MPSTPTPVTAFTSAEDYRTGIETAARAALSYYGGDDLELDDGAYDALVRGIAAAEVAHPDWVVDHHILDAVGAGVVGGDVAHTVPMLSLDNVFSPTELTDWGAGLTRRLGRPAAGFTVEPKMDGLAIAARYVAGALTSIITRGDGAAGEDVTYAAATIVGLPAALNSPVDIEVRGEVLLTDAQFEAANEARLAHGDKVFVNARNGSAGTLRGAKDRGYQIPLTFFCYQGVELAGANPVAMAGMAHTTLMATIAGLGVQTTGMSEAGMGVCSTAGEAIDWVADLGVRRPNLGFAVDGAVIKADAEADRVAAGNSSRAPRWAIAYKYPADTAISTLEEVIWQVGRTGVIAPRARITPVFVGGTTVTYATLHNVDDIARKGFMLGDKVTVLRAGEVIPRLQAPVLNLRDGSQTPIASPTQCPRCGAGLDKSQVRWRCVRGRYCGLGELIGYAVARDALDIEGMGAKVVEQLVATKLVADVADLFTLTRDQLMRLDRMGVTTADKLLAQIAGAKTQPLARVLTALGIRGTGRSMSRRIAAHFGTMDAIVGASAAQLETVDGIGSEKAPLIVAELAEMAEVITKLAAAGVNMGQPPAPTAAPAATGVTAGAVAAAPTGATAPLAGMSVVATGAMTGALSALSRNDVNELIEAAGGKSSGSVSAKTSILVAGDKAGSKLAKATSLGVRVMTPEQFAELVAAYLP